MDKLNKVKHALSCDNISLNIHGNTLLNDVSASFCSDGISVLMGYNGAGKSLLLKVLHGMIEPSAGSVLWKKAPITPDQLKAQAMVFQSPVLLRRSVAQNIDFILRARNNENTTLRNDVLERVGLLDKQNQSARKLSGGEQQRLALARALACKPDVLFLDEATASLDPASAASIEEIVLHEAQTGTKVIAVTHDIAQAKRLATEVVFLHQGIIMETSAAEAFFTEPTCNAARAFLGGKLLV